jgi:hypothetical protein
VRHGDTEYLGQLGADEMVRKAAVVDLRLEFRRHGRKAARQRRLGELCEGEADVSPLAVIAPGRLEARVRLSQ